MTCDDETAMLRMLARLPPASPDAAHADRVKARCRALMLGKARTRHHIADVERRIAGVRARLIERLVIGGFSLIYLAAMVVDVLRWYGLSLR